MGKTPKALLFLGGALLLGAMTAACGGGAGAVSDRSPSGGVQATSKGLPPSASEPAPGPDRPTPSPSFVSQLPPDASPLLRRGEIIFQVEAGGAGCQMCHGREAKGLTGPNIRGKTAVDIEDAIQTRELMMQAIGYLPADDIEAVAAYLSYLADQP